MLIYINKEKAISIHIYVHKHTYGTGHILWMLKS